MLSSGGDPPAKPLELGPGPRAPRKPHRHKVSEILRTSGQPHVWEVGVEDQRVPQKGERGARALREPGTLYKPWSGLRVPHLECSADPISPRR